MMTRSRTLLAGLGATAALAWAPTAIGQIMVTAPAEPFAPTQLIVVEPAPKPVAARHARVRRTETSREVRTTDGRLAMTEERTVVSDADTPRHHFWNRRARTENDEARAKPGFFGRMRARTTEASRADASHIQAHVAAIEPAPAGGAMPMVTALKLDDGSRVLVPRTTAPTARVGDRVNVAYAPGDTGQQFATKFMIDSETEAP